MGLRTTATGSRGQDLARLLDGPGAGLLLDLDGTLVDSEPIHRAAYAEYFAGRGWQVPDSVVQQFSGRRAAEVFATLEGPWAGQDPDLLTEGIIAVLRRTTARPIAVPGARELLWECAAAGLPVAVVTSARREWVRAVMGHLVDDGRTVPVVAAEDYQHGKPDPEPYRLGAALLGLPPGGLVAAEDTSAGIASARSAGVGYVIGVSTGPQAPAGADAIHPDLWPLTRAVEGTRRGAAGPGPRAQH
ncbi:HAD family phosphatase [Cellulomonas sp. KRMCY2]|uniref:HAD family hydrolase n=1 Tax=Cellulomonas sp. KRMCY2 TaxID=1304865 RepID=UPI00045EAEB0|nr:HAD family phosphatase [Cellulomonas sp. KRMCY2]